MTQPEYQPHPTAAAPAAPVGGPEILSTQPSPPYGAAPAATGSPGSPARVSRGLLAAAWVAAVALAVLALVAVVWTIELVRIQIELEQAARAVRDYIAQFSGGLGGGGGATQCPNGEPVC
jgi:hypothetical protein